MMPFRHFQSVSTYIRWKFIALNQAYYPTTIMRDESIGSNTNNMKSFLLFSFFTLILTALFSSGCGDDRCTREQEYTQYQPVYKRIDEMRMPAAYVAPTSLKE